MTSTGQTSVVYQQSIAIPADYAAIAIIFFAIGYIIAHQAAMSIASSVKVVVSK